MFKKIINSALLTFTVLLLSCGKGGNKNAIIPPNILGEEAFTKLLVDFSLAESAANLNIKKVPVTQLDSVYAFDPLVENNIRREQYDSTLLFYSQNADLYKKIYENVLAQLTELQAKRATKVDSTRK